MTLKEDLDSYLENNSNGAESEDILKMVEKAMDEVWANHAPKPLDVNGYNAVFDYHQKILEALR